MSEPTILDSAGNRLQVGDRVQCPRGPGEVGRIGLSAAGRARLTLRRDGAHSVFIYATTSVDTNGPLGIHFICPDLTLIPTQEDD